MRRESRSVPAKWRICVLAGPHPAPACRQTSNFRRRRRVRLMYAPVANASQIVPDLAAAILRDPHGRGRRCHAERHHSGAEKQTPNLHFPVPCRRPASKRRCDLGIEFKLSQTGGNRKALFTKNLAGMVSRLGTFHERNQIGAAIPVAPGCCRQGSMVWTSAPKRRRGWIDMTVGVAQAVRAIFAEQKWSIEVHEAARSARAEQPVPSQAMSRPCIQTMMVKFRRRASAIDGHRFCQPPALSSLIFTASYLPTSAGNEAWS